MLKLYSYFRSSASFRVRIALELKGLSYDYVPVHLLKEGGQQLKPEFRAVNPDGLVPALVDGEHVLQQSLAIVEYLDEVHPEPKLLPGTALDRAYVRGLAQEIACEIHPLNNLRVLKYLKHTVGVTDEVKDAWYRHWIELGFASLQANLERSGKAGRFCFGDTPTLADLCLVPQVFNAQRFNIDVARYPAIAKIYETCMALPAFQKAEPKSQPDAE
ncbi:maleylacetoacetate isomerase [Cupriavidus taiwanensis]|uniref:MALEYLACETOACETATE ISOMERASE n=2 Tax=Cupriavidus taiwanensis TaxID=164546 RepID=B2AGS8_CUPTR|nr:maleylacetoacetate isomerase [Cupriavidus taiwanensis]CAP62977.1 putative MALEYLACETOACETATE ISOMERASE [Cupriavidus taiwanensis LMG 19424]SOY87399.1 putative MALEYLACETOACETATE ISOMERASE [Cupriavidus taiwanensis]SOZ01183.1 putative MALEYLACETOACETATE ISOMERASE [Cupriavidus taiwanensis]SOZ04099.1 putative MALEYLACETOACETATE ISOMERASE [Cupriavidus taiwanensis]SPC08126.1 putative maleylacetoacetate isomerase [Cupriavidus taiwanensis]